MGCSLSGSSVHVISQAGNGVVWHFLFQGIFQTQRLSLCLLHLQTDILCLSHQENPSFPFGSVQLLSQVWPFLTTRLQHARLPCPSPTPGACSNSCPLSWWCHPAISSSVVPFFFCLQSFSASGSFQMTQFFPSGGQSIEASASASVLPVNIQDWFPLGLAGSISLQSKGL